MKPTHLDLFSGIGGFALAAEAAGFETIAFCEIDPDASLVLTAQFPGVPNLGDIKKITRDMVDGIANLCDNPDMLNSKYDKAKELYESGLSIAEVADYFQVSRQAMHKILLRRNCVMRPQKKDGEENHFFRGGARHDKRASYLVERAVSKGILIPQSCEICHGTDNVQAHHDDYSKPLEVRWLCKKHHHEWHTKNKAKNGKEATTRTSAKQRIDLLTAGVP
jgi:hypothetical protein